MSVKNVMADEPQAALPRDEYSVALRKAGNHPTGVTKQSVVELIDDYGNSVTWVIKTVRVESRDTVFLQKNDGTPGGGRWVLPPAVTEVLARQRDGATSVNRKRGARAGAATRKALGIVPPPLPKRKKESA